MSSKYVTTMTNVTFYASYRGATRAVPATVLYGQGNNDECYTPPEPVKIVQKYIKPGEVVWCPFDKADSNFVRVLSRTHEVIHTHIGYGQDFYKYEPDRHYDVIVSNSPFTNKRKIFERALSLNKPFALLMTNTWLNDSAPKKLFGDGKDLQLLMFDKRIKFSVNGVVDNKITFSSSFYCWNFLPKQIVMENL